VIEDDEVEIRVDGRPVPCRPGRPLLSELLRRNLVVQTACGGQGSCHLCRVTLLSRDVVPPPSDLEKRALGNVLIASGMRLSCQIEVTSGMQVQLPSVETPEQRRERIRRARERKRREKRDP